MLSNGQWAALARSLSLSGRELEILQCIFDDSSEAAMALELGISSHTVHTHLERLYRKLGVTSRCAAAVRVFAEHCRQQSPASIGRRPAPRIAPPHH